MRPLARSTHEDPVHHIALGRLWQEVRPIVVAPQLPGLFAVAGAPPDVPGVTGQVGAGFVHRENFLQGVQTRFVGEEEAVVDSLPHFAVAVEVGEEVEAELLLGRMSILNKKSETLVTIGNKRHNVRLHHSNATVSRLHETAKNSSV